MRTVKDKTCIFRFENLVDIPQWLEAHPKRAIADHNASTKTSNNAWYGGVTYNQTLELVKSGWKEGANKVDAVKTRHVDRLTGPTEELVRTKFNPARAGGMVVVPQAIAGHPQCFRRPVSQHRSTPVLNLWWLVATNCNMKSTAFVNQGVALLAVIDQVERRGIRVGVTVFSGTYSGERACGWSCIVKRPQDRLQIHQLAFPLAHAAYFRRLGFALMERQGSVEQCQPFIVSYGMPIDSLGDQTREKVKGLVPKDALCVIPRYTDDIDTAYNKIHTQITKELS